MKTGIDHFIEVVWRNVGGHADRNAARAIDQQIGQSRGQHQRLFFRPVVVGSKVHGFLVQISQQLMRNFGQPDFGVAHGSGVVAVNRAEITLTINQHMAHGKGLRHTHDGVIHRLVSMRVILTNHITHNTRRFFIRLVPVVAELMHGKQYTPVHRFEAIARVGQSPSNDHAHGVIQVAAAHFVGQTGGQGFFGELGHGTT
ncbi:hypothetical protein GALL_482710 [mine drainage metagenome]|uniref:Uncharacterized protein n=1 Tax=mine drainage metagenome TaxID=410659 RepID=A0A1J5PFG5_9ZZZZ